MATAPQKSAALVRAEADLKKAQAAVAKAKAAADPVEGGEGQEEDPPAPDPEEPAPVEPAPAPADDEEDEADPPAPDARSEAAKISASAEADTHPHLAMAAIRSGQTHAQFLANVAATGKAPKKGALANFMAAAPRLGPDGKASASGDGMGGLLLADAKKKAAASPR